MEAYSLDLRDRVMRACDEQAGTRAEIAEMFGVSTAWIRRLLQRRREDGSYAAKPHGGGRRPALDQPHLDKLQSLVRQQPDATIAELRERIGVVLSRSAMGRALLLKLGLTRKKSRFMRRNATRRGSSGCDPGFVGAWRR